MRRSPKGSRVSFAALASRVLLGRRPGLPNTPSAGIPASFIASRLVAIKTVIVRITVEMYRAVQFALVVCWVVWAWPFMAYKARTPKRPAEVTVNASRWGIGLQMVGFFLAWLRIPGFTPRPWPWLVIALLLAA